MSYKHVISRPRLVLLVISCALITPLGYEFGRALALENLPETIIHGMLIGIDFFFIMLALKDYDKERESPN